ncbi:hypothetical protein IT575_01645 [bacterium]|nr:hypothetical protein [bacterium]
MRCPRYSIALCAAGLTLLGACAPDSQPVSADNRSLQPAYHSELNQLTSPTGVDAAVWQELRRELERVLAATGADKAVASVPGSTDSKVDDLAVSGSIGGDITFSFTYHNCGDYNQDGRVAVSDLSPIGIHFLDHSGSATWAGACVADGDMNGLVNVADLTPIGIHYLTQCDGYQLQGASDPNAATWDVLADLQLDGSSFPDDGSFRRFHYTLSNSAAQMWYRVVPYLGSGAARQFGIDSNPVYFGLGQILPPENFTASQGAYSDRVSLSWTKSAEALNYRVFRDQQDTPLAELGDVSTYDDLTPADTTPHNYWIQAVNGVRVSNFSAPAIGWLKAGTTALEAPSGVSASDGTSSEKISISWNKVSGASGYEIYRDTQSSPLAVLGDAGSYEDAVADAYAHTYWLLATGAGGIRSAFSASDTGYRGGNPSGGMVVLAYNDLGMHCMNEDFSSFMILPPFNTLHAQVIDRSGEEPRIVKSGVSIRYSIKGNTYSVGKTNFWDFEDLLFGVDLAPNVGLTGNGMSGFMQPSGGSHTDWQVTGIPVTPVNDDQSFNPYQLATVSVFEGGVETARTEAVVPVSWEISCNICHGNDPASILRSHDSMHGTNLENSQPVVCGTCHAQPELGMPGLGSLPTLSSAVHSAHAGRMAMAGLENSCYACHPGINTRCLRDVHYSAGVNCVDCHGDMAAVGNPARQPWVDEPRCGDCHSRAGFEFEQPGVLFRDSLGHHGIQCSACHGSPHAVTPTVQVEDNLQAIAVQGHPGTIDTCTVCHQNPPDEFEHFYEADDD